MKHYPIIKLRGTIGDRINAQQMPVPSRHIPTNDLYNTVRSITTWSVGYLSSLCHFRFAVLGKASWASSPNNLNGRRHVKTHRDDWGRDWSIFFFFFQGLSAVTIIMINGSEKHNFRCCMLLKSPTIYKCHFKNIARMLRSWIVYKCYTEFLSH